jgi:hypothetical protein
MLGTAGIPARSYAAQEYKVNIYSHAGDDAAHAIAEDVGIGLAISAGVAALIGGAIWYYRHHRHADATAAAAIPPAEEPVATAN